MRTVRYAILASAVALGGAAHATTVMSAPVAMATGDKLLCLLSNVSTTTIEGIDIQIKDFAGDPAGGDVFGTSIDDGGVASASTTNPDAQYCKWTFPVGKSKVRLTVLVTDSAGHPRVSMRAE